MKVDPAMCMKTQETMTKCLAAKQVFTRKCTSCARINKNLPVSGPRMHRLHDNLWRRSPQNRLIGIVTAREGGLYQLLGVVRNSPRSQELMCEGVGRLAQSEPSSAIHDCGHPRRHSRTWQSKDASLSPAPCTLLQKRRAALCASSRPNGARTDFFKKLTNFFLASSSQ
jgi:hypothetical protein